MGNTDFDTNPREGGKHGEHTRQQQGSGGGDERTDQVNRQNPNKSIPGESRPNENVKQPGRANEQDDH
jgi:hypothetical protein